MLDRKTPPPFVHTTSFDLIKPERARLSDGADLYVIAGGSQDVLKLELIFQAGRWDEDFTGVSHFAATLLNKGTATKTSFDIARIFDQYGAHIEINPGFDFVSVSVYSLTKYLEPVLDLLTEIVTSASFSERELDQSKTIYLQNLKINEEKTSFLASRIFRKKLFGIDHPYGKDVDERDVVATDVSRILSHFQKRYKGFTAFVSGKISSTDKQKIFNSLAAIETGALSENNISSAKQPRFSEMVPKEGSVQATIRAGKKSIKRDHPDYGATVFVSHILGGYFGSRLMKNIREEKGLTYGIYGSIHPLQQDSYFVVGTDVNKENVNLTMDEVRKELKILRTEPMPSEELHIAKNHFIGSLQSEITTPFAHADKIKTIVLSSLSDDYYQRMISIIDTINTEAIMEISHKHLHEDSLDVVAVG